MRKILGINEPMDGLHKVGKTGLWDLYYGYYPLEDDGADKNEEAEIEVAVDDPGDGELPPSPPPPPDWVIGRNRHWCWRRRFRVRPTRGEVLETLREAINEMTRERILSGFRWAGKRIWLSEQNQANFSSIAKCGRALGYPLRLKVGESKEGLPEYLEFSDSDSFGAFYEGVSAHIMHCLKAGWEEKDSLDVDSYFEKVEQKEG